MRPAIYMDFARSGRLDPRARVIRASGGTRRDATGVYREVPPGTARLHHALDVTPLGILMEPTRTNNFLNPRTLPTGSSGLPSDYTTAGTDSSLTYTYNALEAVLGVQGRRVQLAGTASLGAAQRILSTNAGALPQGDYFFTRFMAFLSGWGSIGTPRLQTFTTVSTGATITPTAALVRYGLAVNQPGPSNNGILGAVNPLFTAGQTINHEIFIGWDQLEGGLYPTTPILPATTGAATRAAETLETLLADWGVAAPGTEGTLLVAGRAAPGLASGGGAQRAIQVDDGTSNNVVRIERTAGRAMRGDVIVGGVSQATATSAGTVADNADMVSVLGYSAGGMALSLNGAAVVEAALGGVPTPSRLLLGDWGQTISRLAWWPRRLSNAEVQTLAGQGAIA